MARDILSDGIGTLTALNMLYPYPEPKAKMKVA